MALITSLDDVPLAFRREIEAWVGDGARKLGIAAPPVRVSIRGAMGSSALASASTRGIVLAPDLLERPSSSLPAWRSVIAHELVHMAQFAAGAASGGDDGERRLEAEADEGALALMSGKGFRARALRPANA